jgi:hypothetical protein
VPEGDNNMKKMMIIIIVPYLVFIGVMLYIYFAPGVLGGYQTLLWKDIEVKVPKDFNARTYQSKGWDVYSLQKLSVLVKIARKLAVDVQRLPEYAGKVIYRFSPGPGTIYYISNPYKTYEVVYARAEAGLTLYFSVRSPSVFSAAYIMEQMTAASLYNGVKIGIAKPSLPLRVYLTDFIFLGGITLPLFIILVVFSLAGAKPSSDYFRGDPILCEENFVYFSRVRKFMRRNNFCYLALTTTRLMVFVFKKLAVEIRLQEEKQGIKIEGKKILIQKPKEKIVLRPSEIEKWKQALGSILE